MINIFRQNVRYFEDGPSCSMLKPTITCATQQGQPHHDGFQFVRIKRQRRQVKTGPHDVTHTCLSFNWQSTRLQGRNVAIDCAFGDLKHICNLLCGYRHISLTEYLDDLKESG